MNRAPAWVTATELEHAHPDLTSDEIAELERMWNDEGEGER